MGLLEIRPNPNPYKNSPRAFLAHNQDNQVLCFEDDLKALMALEPCSADIHNDSYMFENLISYVNMFHLVDNDNSDIHTDHQSNQKLYLSHP